ncbi:AT-rich interactive domain-containing protein 5A [Centroberyx gerrardi]|uniref:AT-rich interactive domain-containing protein 5A n=1 Tax=Centroberyx gerrardi TaxID=166262 RepID=UPI003AAF8FBC
MVLEAEEERSEMSQPAAASEEERGKPNQTSSMIEIHDSTAECEEGARPNAVQIEEKSFVSNLYSFMKDRGTPIERIPHLGFKQINLWRIYKAVEKLGGYDSVTARRLWKNVYDELGGSPGSTSAATCTRRHYERLVLPFERHLRGEEDKPLPPSKPQKQYKRNLDGKVGKAEGKRKRTSSDREMDSELHAQRRPEAACQNEAGMHALSTPWAVTSDRLHPDCSQPNRAAGDLCPSVYACSHLVQVPASSPWTGHIPAAAGEVISPLEKKKRVAQAILLDDKERPSVIRCSQSPALASSSHNCNSSEGSPLPLSSSSSRSPSPYSVSSEDCPAGNEDKPASSTELPPNHPSSINNASGCSEDSKSLSCSPMSKDPAGQNKDASRVSPQSLTTDSSKGKSKDSAWQPIHKVSGRNSAHPCLLSTSSSFIVKSDWVPTSTSSFTKVIPKSVQPLRPAPFPPGYKLHQSRLVQHDDSLTCAKKLQNMAPWLYQTEKREKSRTMLPKPLPTQQSLSHSSVLLTGYDRAGRDSRHQPPLHPPFLPSRMRLSHSQPVYRHFPMSPAHSPFIGSIYSYPYPIPLWSPQTGYTLPGMNSIYPHKL